MTRRDSRSIYEARMHRVLQHIDANISDELDLNTLAEVASFSPSHFHRLFFAWTGERLGGFLRRRRIEIAAARLAAQPALPVLDAALSVGFSSSEAFSRAFKAHFGSAPSTWRRTAPRLALNSNPGQSKGNPSQAGPASSQHHDGSIFTAMEQPLEVRLETLRPVHIAYLRHHGPYGDEVNIFWRQTVFAWMAENSLLGAPRYGISHDDPSITAAAKCRYDACVEVDEKTLLSGRALRATLPGGKYALVEYSGPASQIGHAWSRLLREWLPSSGLQLDGRPCFEYYSKDASYDQKTGHFTCEICVPVAPL